MDEQPTTLPADAFTGKTVGAYRMLEKLGEGGMGAVYRAVHSTLNREVAVKVLPERLVRDRPEFAQRFLIEARAAAQINHPFIVQVYDAGEAGGIHYIAMEYVRGSTLKELLQRRGGPLPLREALKIAVQAAKGLRAATRQKIIHRDVKPANIMISDRGVVKVADFGLAKNLAADISITSSGQTIGTPAYMSPEQGDAEKPDFRSDIYSLGVTLFEMATGRRPFEADSAIRLLMKHMQEPLPDPLSINPGLDPGLRPILEKMMAKAQADRYPSYDALIGDLDRLKTRLEGGSGEPSPEDADSRPIPGFSPAPGAPPTGPDEPTPVTSLDRKGAAAPAPPSPGPAGRLPVWVWASGGIAVLALLCVVLLLALGAFGGGGKAPPGESPESAPPPPAAVSRASEDREADIRAILASAARLEGERRYPEALTVLGQVASLDPNHRGAAEARSRIQRLLEASLSNAERESFYRQYWAAADAGKTRAELSDAPEDWSLVAEAAGKAVDNKPSQEARELAAYALARGDWALARKAAAQGDLDGALELASRAASRGARLEKLAEFAAELRRRKTGARDRSLRKGKFDALAAQAEAAERKGSEADLEAALAAWRGALETADEEADRSRAAAAARRICLDRDWRKGMAQGERAETESRWEDALASFEEALRAKPGDPQSEEAARRVRARLEEVRARDRAARQAEERRLLCEEFSQKAEEAEKAKVRGKTGDLDAAMAFWRKARELADDPEKIRAVDARIEALAGPVFRKALLDARAAEARKDWIAADQACIRAAAARPEDRTVGPLRARVAERLQEISKLVGAFMMFPPDDRDRFGNPVASRGGSLSDPETGLPYEIWLREPRIEFVLVPTGRFKMGSPKTEPGHRPEEAPPMNIHMAQPYYIGKYEATQADWKALLAPMESGLRGEDLPVENVSWHDAKKFAGELNRKAGAAEDAPPYFALPTEAEWEYAARAGSQTPFHSGAVEKDLAAAAWFVRNAEGRTHPVGKREPNAWGLYDAHGNVWEWCLDYFSDSLARRFAEAPDDAKRAGRVLRGGSFGASAEDCRCARRHSADPGDKRPDTGFRLCLKLYPPPKDLPEKK